jgi:phage virion morphogenesis protein
MEIEIAVQNDEITGVLQRLQARLHDLTPVMRSISGIMLDAVEENFAQEGRPRWKPSISATKRGGKTLQKSGRLAASISRRWSANTAQVGTNVVYAAIHQFGGKTKPHVIKAKNKQALFWPGARHPVKAINHPGSVIPARPFLSLTDEDLDDIRAKILEYLLP